MFKKFFLFLFLVCVMVSCSNNKQIKFNNIVCFGDSLTEGYGATEGKSYPYYLQQLVNVPVINKGIDGNTTKDGLDRLDDILQFKNALVIVEFGANDFFHQVPMSQTKKNIESIIKSLKQNNDIVVLVSTEDNHLLIANNLYDTLKTVAKENNILFIDGILNEIWNDRSLFSDEVHPNSDGYKLVADKIYKNIKHLF